MIRYVYVLMIYKKNLVTPFAKPYHIYDKVTGFV